MRCTQRTDAGSFVPRAPARDVALRWLQAVGLAIQDGASSHIYLSPSDRAYLLRLSDTCRQPEHRARLLLQLRLRLKLLLLLLLSIGGCVRRRVPRVVRRWPQIAVDELALLPRRGPAFGDNYCRLRSERTQLETAKWHARAPTLFRHKMRHICP